MPRKGVPYGGAICSLKERIAELFDLVGEKLHSINGIRGDGQGNLKLKSGDPAVVITGDAAQNEIKIALDNSKLPSAAVSSVNGETGAVVLDAGDIPTHGNSDVQTDIDAGKTGLKNCIVNIIAEQEARQNADAALQGNINSVQASIPGAAAAAVAADPTVARLARDVPDKVDKITGGSIKRAYTHTGSVQDDTPAVNGTDANSIGLRDANGRMQAADPAAGATDKTLVTANWISQTGDSAPNNLVHKIGNEIINGVKIFSNGIKGYSNNFHSVSISDQAINDISLFARLENSSHGKYIIFDAIQSSNTGMCAGQFMVENRTDNMAAMWLWRKVYNNINNPIFGNCLVIANKDGEYYLGWRKLFRYGSMQVRDNLAWSYLTINSYPTNQIEWIEKINIGTGDGYIITEVNDASTYTE